MKKARDICVHIKSKQTSVESGTDSIEFYTEGKFYEKGTAQYISYKESEISGMEGTTSMIKIEPGIVTLTRVGAVSSKLVFRKGRPTRTVYATQFGNFDMTIDTSEIGVHADEKGEYKLFLKYSLNILGLGSTVNELSLSFKN